MNPSGKAIPLDHNIDEHSSVHDTYACIAQAIAFMRQNNHAQPDLKAIAQHINRSEHHVQHLFTQWAGIQPHRFSQYLTLEYTKSKIAETKRHLELTEAHVSSPDRSPGLFVKLNAMSPEEYKAAGAGLKICYGMYDTPFGHCVIATTPRGVCNLHFLDTTGKKMYERTAVQQLRAEWPQAELIHDQQATKKVGDRIFHSTTDHPSPLVLHVKGTNFQIQVWQALLSIPFAGITTYRGLAELIGRPTAARAIGTAIGRNPVGYVIPCHRVIRESGEMGGYRWGLDRKAALLGWEASHHQPFLKANA